jgi:hypothetical protein
MSNILPRNPVKSSNQNIHQEFDREIIHKKNDLIFD